MRKKVLCILFTICLLSFSCKSSEDNSDEEENNIIAGAKLPPTGLVTRIYPRLVNYYHMAYQEGFENSEHLEEYLAQWNVVILKTDDVRNLGISLTRMREVNPSIIILGWIPIGQCPWHTDAIAEVSLACMTLHYMALNILKNQTGL